MTKETMELTQDDVERILKLIDESGYDEIQIEHGDLKVHVRRHGIGAEMPAMEASQAPPPTAGPTTRLAAPPSPASIAKSVELPEGLVAVRAPMLGTFYRAPSPGSPPFTQEGTVVAADATVCIIEVMKLFNTLRAGTHGRVVRFLVENGEMVEFDQPLLLIDPKAAG